MANKYIKSLQALRAIAFLCILTYHCGLTPLAPWGVIIFFMLSGFVLTLKYHDRALHAHFWNNIKFSIKRMKKIYVLHILMIIVVVIREFIQIGIFELNLTKLLANILLLSSWFPPSIGLRCYNGVAWFLSTIMFSYFMFPVLLGFINGKPLTSLKRIILIILFVQVAILILLRFISVCNDIEVWLIYEHPIFRMCDFFVGMLLCMIYLENKDKIVPNATPRELTYFFILALSCVIDLFFCRPKGLDGFRKTLLYFPAAILFIYSFALNQDAFSKLLTSRFMVYIGNMSGFYFLIHQFVIYNTKWALYGLGPWGGILDRIVVCVVSFIVTVVLAYLYKSVQDGRLLLNKINSLKLWKDVQNRRNV